MCYRQVNGTANATVVNIEALLPNTCQLLDDGYALTYYQTILTQNKTTGETRASIRWNCVPPDCTACQNSTTLLPINKCFQSPGFLGDISASNYQLSLPPLDGCFLNTPVPPSQHLLLPLVLFFVALLIIGVVLAFKFKIIPTQPFLDILGDVKAVVGKGDKDGQFTSVNDEGGQQSPTWRDRFRMQHVKGMYMDENNADVPLSLEEMKNVSRDRICMILAIFCFALILGVVVGVGYYNTFVARLVTWLDIDRSFVSLQGLQKIFHDWDTIFVCVCALAIIIIPAALLHLAYRRPRSALRHRHGVVYLLLGLVAVTFATMCAPVILAQWGSSVELQPNT